MTLDNTTDRTALRRRSKPWGLVLPPRGTGTRLAALVSVGALALISGCGAPATDTAPAPPIPAPPAAAALSEKDVNAWLDGRIPAALKQTGIAGASVSVVHNGKVLTARGYGYSHTGVDGSKEQPVDPDETLFRAGSVSKLFTATAVMQQVEKGKVDLDTDVKEYLDFSLPRSFEDDITMRHLLTHTAGFEERVARMVGTGKPEESLRDHLRTDPPAQAYKPGTVPAYSNYGNALAGYIVERVSGVPFADYVQKNVLDKAGMKSSTFAQPLPKDLAGRLSQGYNSTDPGSAVPFEVVGASPAGAMTTSATDMARYMQAQLGETGPEQALLAPETRTLMHKPALGADSLGNFAKGQRMALGYFNEDRNGHRIVGHGGDTQYFHTHMQIYPDDATGIFIALNSNGRGSVDSLKLREHLVTGFADRYFPPSAEDDTSVEPEAEQHAAMAAGTYESSRNMHSNFLNTLGLNGETQVTARKDGTLLIEPGPVDAYPAVYEEIEPWVWREVGGQRVIAMRVVDDQVEAIGFEAAFTLLRVDPVRQAAVALPVLVASAAILLIALLSWPIGAVVRRSLSLPGRSKPHDRKERVARILTRISVVSAVLAVAGWVMAILAVAGMTDVPQAALVVLFGMLMVGGLGVIPAAMTLYFNVRRRAGWWRSAGSALILLALIGLTWFSNTFNLLAPNLSY